MLQNATGITKCVDYYKTGHNSKHVKSEVMQKSCVHNATIEWISRWPSRKVKTLKKTLISNRDYLPESFHKHKPRRYKTK